MLSYLIRFHKAKQRECLPNPTQVGELMALPEPSQSTWNCFKIFDRHKNLTDQEILYNFRQDHGNITLRLTCKCLEGNHLYYNG